MCPVEAIYYEDDLPDKWQIYLADNARFFSEPLPGRPESLGSPGGAAQLGPLGVDTELVSGHTAPAPTEPCADATRACDDHGRTAANGCP